MPDLLRRWCLAPLLIALCVPALAYQGEAGPGDSSQVAATQADPRGVISDFLAGMKAYTRSEFLDASQHQRALSSFGSSSQRKDAEKIAQQLYAVLNRTALIDTEEFPTTGDPELAGGRWVWAKSPPSEPDMEIELIFSQQGSAWALAGESLDKVASWHEALKNQQPVGEFLEDLPFLDRKRWEFRNSLPQGMREQAFILENWQWLGILFLVFFGVLAERVVTLIISRLTKRAAGRVAIDEETFGNFKRPFGLLMVSAIFRWTLPLLGLEPEHHRILLFAAGFVLAVAGVWTAYRIVDVICSYLSSKADLTENTFDDMLVPLLERTLKILITIVGLVYIASLLSGDLYGIIAGLSIGSLAVGFAAKDSIENLFGTFTVLLDKPFALGDYVSVGSVEGSIEKVGFRSTRLRTGYNSLITVPNSRFINSDVDNYGARQYRRIKTMLGLTYDTPPTKLEAFCEGVRELIRRHPHTRKDSFHVYVHEFGPNSIDVLLQCHIVTADRSTELQERERLYLDILKLAESLKVEFAFPTQTVHMMRPEDAPDHSDAPQSSEAAGERGRELAQGLTPEE